MTKAKPYTSVRFPEGCLIFLLAIVANLCMQLLLSAVSIPLGNAATSDYFQLLGMFALQAAFLAVPLIYYACKPYRPRLYAPFCKPSPWHGFALLLPIIAMAAFSLPAMFFGTALREWGYDPAGVNMDTPGKLVLGMLAILVVAPVVEEIIFRGFLLSGLRRAFPPIVAAILSGLAFALMHMNPAQTVYQFCLGTVCALGTLYGGNLLVAVVTHAGSNLLALFVDAPIARAADYLWGRPALAALVSIGAALAGGALVWLVCLLMRKKTGKTAPAEGETVNADTAPQAEEKAPERLTSSDKRAGIGLYAGGAALCVVMWIFVLAASIL